MFTSDLDFVMRKTQENKLIEKKMESFSLI